MNNNDALNVLMAEFGPAIARVAALYEFDPGLRQDLVQEIWLSVWRALPRFREESSRKTFIFRIAHNRAISHVRKRSSEQKLVSDTMDNFATPDSGPFVETDSSQHAGLLLQAMQRLPVVDRQILQLTLEGLKQQEIAVVIGLSENNIAVRLTRARKRLRTLLGNNP